MKKRIWMSPLTASFVLTLFSAGARGSSPDDKVVAYYFHNTIRCATCLRIESYSKHSIEAGFRPELNSGRVEFHAVNMQLPENKHFVKEFHLSASSLILVHIKNGKQVHWRNLDAVWELVGDLSHFMKYVQFEVKRHLDSH